MMLAATGSADWGVSALACALLMLFWGWLFEIPEGDIKGGGYFANAILFGLYLGNTFSSIQMLILTGFTGSFLLFILNRSLIHVLWNKYHLPVCSYPFVLAVFLFTFLCGSEEYWFKTAFLRPWSYSGIWIDEFFHNPFRLNILDKLAYEVLGFVFSVGSIFFQKKFIFCLLATIGMTLTSRILTLLAILGYAISRVLMLVFPFFCGGHEVAFGFNAILIGIAIGGGFFVPGKKAIVLMISSQFLGFFLGLISIASTRLTGGEWTALPFNLVVSGILLALQGRNPQAKPMRPGIAFETPEEAIVYYRRYEERIFLRSVSFPAFGRWQIVQGFNGNETHKEAWRYGVDLAAVDESGSRFRFAGKTVEDYFSFSAPVLSPVDGVVSAAWSEIEDNPLGIMNMVSPWGNYVIIYSAGIYIGLYHLKKGSTLVVPGQSVSVGTPLGRGGNSGRSALPHIHFQLQLHPAAGSENIPFLFHDLLVEEDTHRVFYVFFKPEESRIVSSIPSNDAHRLLFFPRNGEFWRLEKEENGKQSIISWKFTYTLHGNVIVTSDEGEEIEYQVGVKSVEVIRFSARGFSSMNLFALSLSDMPFDLQHDIQWKTVLFGKNAYHFLGFSKKVLSWIFGDIFSAMCFKTTIEEAKEGTETMFSIVSVLSSTSMIQSPVGMQIVFHFGRHGFLSLDLKTNQQTLVHIRKIASE